MKEGKKGRVRIKLDRYTCAGGSTALSLALRKGQAESAKSLASLRMRVRVRGSATCIESTKQSKIETQSTPRWPFNLVAAAATTWHLEKETRL